MISTEFYNKHLESYAAVFGTLFNSILLQRADESTKFQTFKVPISYASKDKTLAALEDAEKKKDTAIKLPRMSFEIVDIGYAPSRKRQTTIRTVSPDQKQTVWMPVPYDITFQLNIITKNQTDGFRIVEQILPYFTPDWTVTMELPDPFNDTIDVPIELQAIAPIDDFEGDMYTRARISWQLTFVMRTHFFGPITKPKLIKKVNINTFDFVNSGLITSTVITPGLDRDGNPTTDPTETIPYREVQPDDNYDYIIKITEND